MADPGDLIDVARMLVADRGGLTGAHLRRAVSTAYYAVFHAILRDAASRFVGAADERAPAYAIVYRGFDHSTMREVCKELRKPTLAEKYKRTLARSTMSGDIRDFADAFAALQEMRHLADYHPKELFEFSDVEAVIEIAADAIAAFGRADAAEKADVLAVMMVGVRA